MHAGREENLAEEPPAKSWPPDDEAADIRYSLTALGEALVHERARSRFRGFGPCSAATIRRAV